MRQKIYAEYNETNTRRSNYVGWTHFRRTIAIIFATFLKTVKTTLNCRLNSTATDYVLLIFIVIPL